jgi:hypothetical protein
MPEYTKFLEVRSRDQLNNTDAQDSIGSYNVRMDDIGFQFSGVRNIDIESIEMPNSAFNVYEGNNKLSIQINQNPNQTAVDTTSKALSGFPLSSTTTTRGITSIYPNASVVAPFRFTLTVPNGTYGAQDIATALQNQMDALVYRKNGRYPSLLAFTVDPTSNKLKIQASVQTNFAETNWQILDMPGAFEVINTVQYPTHPVFGYDKRNTSVPSTLQPMLPFDDFQGTNYTTGGQSYTTDATGQSAYITMRETVSMPFIIDVNNAPAVYLIVTFSGSPFIGSDCQVHTTSKAQYVTVRIQQRASGFGTTYFMKPGINTKPIRTQDLSFTDINVKVVDFSGNPIDFNGMHHSFVMRIEGNDYKRR